MKIIILIFILFTETTYAQRVLFTSEIPHGKLVEERLCSPKPCVTVIKLVYSDSVVVLHRTDSVSKDNIIKQGMTIGRFPTNAANPIFGSIESRNFVLSDTTFVCVWRTFTLGFCTCWFAKFSMRNNRWQTTVFQRILDYAEGASSTSYLAHFLNENVVYLRAGENTNSINHNEFEGVFVILNKDGSLTKFTKIRTPSSSSHN